MSQRFFEQRYRQARVILVAALVGLVAQGVIWFAGVTRGVDDPWVKWPNRAAALLFVVAVFELVMPALEAKAAIDERKYPSLAERVAYDRVFFSGVIGFVLGCIAFLLVVYKLIVHAT